MKAATILTIASPLMAGCVLGWFAHAPRTVHAAADPGPVSFQLQGTGPSAQLGIYFSNERDLYVYPGVTAGSSAVNCAYKLHISKAGGPLERTNCSVGKLD